MDTLHYIILSNNDYGTLWLVAGLGWGLWIATLAASIVIDHIKWCRWINGQ